MSMQVTKYSVTEAAVNTMRERLAEVTDEAITKLGSQLEGLSADTPGGYAQVMKGLSETRRLRVTVERVRKELKADSLLWGRTVDSEARRIREKLEALEQPLKLTRQLADEKAAAEQAARQEAERKLREEQERIEREQREAEHQREMEQQRELAERERQAEQEKLAAQQKEAQIAKELAEKQAAEAKAKAAEAQAIIDAALQQKREAAEKLRQEAEDAANEKMRREFIPDIPALREYAKAIEAVVPAPMKSQAAIELIQEVQSEIQADIDRVWQRISAHE